jgi:hypothetical protein
MNHKPLSALATEVGPARRGTLFTAWVTSCSLALASAAAPTYNIATLGLYDSDHTRFDGYQYSVPTQLNSAGQVTGYSYLYNGGFYDSGRSAWFYDGATTIDVGLTGPEHTRADGYKYSGIQSFNEAGQLLGFSQRFNGGSDDLGLSYWVSNGATTIDIGLTDGEHTRNDGYKYTDAIILTQAGQVFGESNRYDGSTYMGQTAWLYDGSTTKDVGLVDPEHTSDNGFKSSSPYQMNSAGQVTGFANRYNGLDYFGQSVWLYDGSTTTDIGLVGPEHTNYLGYKYSQLVRMTEAGRVSGYAYRYNGGSDFLGYSAWLYDGTTTHDIGLAGPEYTRDDGYKESSPTYTNEAGQVAGSAVRYNGTDYRGLSTWLYDGATTKVVGLVGPEHTRDDGYKYSHPSYLNEAGRVTGSSERYNGGSAYLGQSAWLYDGTTTLDIGLTGPEHTRDDGYKFNVPSLLNEAGQVAGVAYRYNGGSADLGQSAWLYDGTTTKDIGLTGPEHTRDDGYKSSWLQLVNEGGQVLGSSTRYASGHFDLGTSVWLYDGTTTHDIGLTGPAYTRDDGFEQSIPGQLNGAGQVIGTTSRYNGGAAEMGQDAWFYDPVLDQTFALQLSTRSDGYALSYANYFGEDGLVLGSYELFDALDDDLGLRAYSFTVSDGLHDLGPLVNGGLAGNGWEWLANAYLANNMGLILGVGKLTSQPDGQAVYLLRPAVPEPSGALLLLLGIGGLSSHRRRRAPPTCHRRFLWKLCHDLC